MRLLGTLSLLGWLITPGCWGLYCPDEVRGSVGGSLSVSCQYKQGLEKYSKFWCKGAVRIHCPVLVKSESDGKGIKQRISIRDNKERRYFEVIMSNLTKEDSGVYRCGIDEKQLPLRDSSCTIHVAVSPAPTLDPDEGQTTSKPTEKLLTTKGQEKLTPTEPPDSEGFTEATSESSSFSAPTSFPGYMFFLIVPGLKTLSLLCLVFAMIWMHRQKRQPSRAGPPNTTMCLADHPFLPQQGDRPSRQATQGPSEHDYTSGGK